MLLALGLAGCGSTTGPDATPTRHLVAQGTFSSVLGTPAAKVAGFNADAAVVPFATTTAGTLDVKADWTSASNNIDLFVFTSPCTATQAISGDCTELSRTSSTTTKPEQLSVPGFAAGSYVLAIANFGSTTEAGTYEIYSTY